MFVEIAKPVTLVLCILSLYGVFCAAFLDPASDLQQTIIESLGLLALAGGISLTSGLIFREAMPKAHSGAPPLRTTLPVQVFCWASGVMLVVFILSWYLKTHCIFYRDIRFY